MNVALRPEHLNIISLCTGGAGLDLGLELAVQGARTVCMVEREAFAISSLVSAMEQGLLHPAPIWSDARTFDGRAWRGAVDGLIGGIPCQPHSLAGKRLGEEDERDLWSTARRIIVQSGAWFVLIENVRGMLSSGGAERVWRDLRRLGFTSEGGLFTASEVGASHERERVFILAVADDAERRRRVAAAARERDQSPRTDRSGGCDVRLFGLADADRERLEGKRADAGAIRRQDARRSAGLCDRATLDHAIGRRRAEGRHDHRSNVGYEPDTAGEQLVDDASIARGRTVSVQPRRQDEASSDSDGAVVAMGNAYTGSQEVGKGYAPIRSRGAQQPASDRAAGRDTGLFPPSPNDLDGWRSALAASPELEPAFRRVADGLAPRLDIGRVDRLRMLGNGVVPLEAAYAIRTLVTRLAARGSAGAARLVRLMEAA